jgi:hypothetical protein
LIALIDPPASLRLHVTRRRLAQHPDRGQVGIHDATKIGQAEFGDRRAVVDAGIGDQDVHAPMARDDVVHAALCRFGVGDVKGRRLTGQTLITQRGHPLIERCGIARVEHHMRPAARQRFGHRPAQTARGASHQGHLVAQVEHGLRRLMAQGRRSAAPGR